MVYKESLSLRLWYVRYLRELATLSPCMCFTRPDYIATRFSDIYRDFSGVTSGDVWLLLVLVACKYV